MYRHWDTWEDGAYNHVFYAGYGNNAFSDSKDIMKGEPFNSPQMPFGGPEDICWDATSTGIIYVCKKKSGKEAALSTNTDIYYYSLADQSTINLSKEGKGFDTQPASAPKTPLVAWTSMAREGFEADKNDVVIGNLATGNRYNLTEDWDGTVDAFHWSSDGSRIYFIAVKEGTEQLFEIMVQQDPDKNTEANIRQLTHGDFDLNALIGQSGEFMITSKSDMNHANELVRVNLTSGAVEPLTAVNKSIYDGIKLSHIEKMWSTASDGKKLFSWIIYDGSKRIHRCST
jgi:dipeptidyl aminopeptidase/acylaminoacyl peptidase